MYCKKCGFINKGIETHCPYCGAEFESLKTLDKKINFFNWFFISVRHFIVLCGINLFLVLIGLNIVFNVILDINVPILPWGFLGIFGFITILNNFILKSNKKEKLLFWKSMLLAIGFSIIFLLSYSDNDLSWMHITRWQLLLGYYYPILSMLIFILGFINFVLKKEFNVFSNFFYVLFLVVLSALNFGLSFIPSLGLAKIQSAQLIIYCSFIFTIFAAFNVIMFCIFRMRSKWNYENVK